MTILGRETFFHLVERVTNVLKGGEVLLASFAGEESDFVRFNRALVRQAMTIRQGYVTLSLIEGARRDTTTIALSGDREEDGRAAVASLRAMRDGLAGLPEDPYLLYSTEPSASDRVERGRLPSPSDALATILDAARGTDLVGIYASGPMKRGFASSLGHRHFHEVDGFQFDWSVYRSSDKAVSMTHASRDWEPKALVERIEQARATLGQLGRPARTISPGAYRAFLSPAAVAELVAMLNWGGVSEKARRTKTSAIQKLSDGELSWSPKLTLRENTAAGLAPSFDDVGFRKPPMVDLVVGGVQAASLVGPRTAREYGLDANADGEETLRSAELEAGTLDVDEVLAALDTGVYVANLWYLNFSDRVNARVTGMTRFATFWVEGGRIVAPLNVMRFDDTLHRMFGENLVALTREREFIMSTSTYSERSVETGRFPGMLLGALTLTL